MAGAWELLLYIVVLGNRSGSLLSVPWYGKILYAKIPIVTARKPAWQLLCRNRSVQRIVDIWGCGIIATSQPWIVVVNCAALICIPDSMQITSRFLSSSSLFFLFWKKWRNFPKSKPFILTDIDEPGWSNVGGRDGSRNHSFYPPFTRYKNMPGTELQHQVVFTYY